MRADHPDSPATEIDLGFAQLRASSGDHVAHFYTAQDEWKSLLVPFLSAGIEAGHRCVCLAKGSRHQDIIESLQAHDVDTDQALDTTQLLLTDGLATPSENKAYLQEVLADVPERFGFLRWVGDMTWAHDQMSDSATLMEWEACCNCLPGATPAVFLCLYELSCFPGTVIMDAIRTHPLCIMGSSIHENPYYESPEVFLEALRQRETTSLTLR